MVHFFSFWFSFSFLLSIWIFYPLLLKLSIIINNKYFPTKNQSNISPSLPVSVIIAAHNEANSLEKRCINILTQNYNGDIEIIIASDGSNDSTKEVAEALAEEHKNILFINIQPQQGRSNAHNTSISYSNYEILVFTDAETVFEDKCISKLVSPFNNENVGFVSGTLKYINQNNNSISESIGMYWKFEMFLRRSESELGLYATGTGACCAVRKSLYKKIPATGDVDFITPLDVILAGKKCIHSNDAIAWDELPDTPKKEFSARVRMTSKNIKGTLTRWKFSSILFKPAYSISIFLHKIGRWITPFFLVSLFFSNIFLLSDSYAYVALWIAQLSFYLLGFLGFMGINFIFSSLIYSFILANIGFFIGVLKALFKNVPHLYKPIKQE